MSKDLKSTVIGIVVACIIAAGTYLEAGVDPYNPGWWIGLVTALSAAIKGYYHNKPEPVLMADTPTEKPPVA